MAGDPAVSVCIPAFNHANYIGPCVESVLAQTFSDFEIVVTDDGSSDGTADVVASLSDSRIRLFRFPRNQGPSAAANNNFRAARGAYICPLASDDMFHPEKLSKQLAFLNSNRNVGVVFSYLRYVDENGTPFADHSAYRYTDVRNRTREEWLNSFLTEGNSLAAPTAMIRRDVLNGVGPVDNRLLQTQDFDLWVRICLLHDIHVLEERLVDYRVRANQQNTSANVPFKQSQTHWELIKVMERFCSISDADLRAAFPQAERLDPGLPRLAKLSIVAQSAGSRFAQAFGLELMYRLLADDGVAEELSRVGYDWPAFYKAAGTADICGIVATRQGWDRVDSLKLEYDQLAAQFHRTQDEYKNAMHALGHWKEAYERIAQSLPERVLRRLREVIRSARPPSRGE